MRKVQTVVMCFVIAALACCQSQPISLSPLPSRVERIEGHAALVVTGDQGTARSKFSFLFHLPNWGRIDVFGTLGRILYRIIILDEEAYFVVPQKKVYWKGQEEEIIDKFLGFRLNLTEMINLLSGNWDQSGVIQKKDLKDWSFVKDREGRIISGQREDLWFKVEEFIGNTPFAHRIIFNHPLSSGQVKVLSIDLNRPIKENVFSKKFIKLYQPKTWAEIQELLDHAR